MHKLLRPVVALVVAMATASACTGDRIALPNQPPSDGGLAALLGPATLVVDTIDRVACIAADVAGQRTALVWPDGYYALPTTPTSIINAADLAVAKVGDTVWLGGGLAPGPWPQLGDCPDHNGRVWWVADLSHSAP